MFEDLLEKYKMHRTFTFTPNENLKDKCNAPTNKGGVYLIYKVIDGSEILIYIGSSGQKKDGQLKVRQSGLGGMKDRLVNGHHAKFGKIGRRKTFPDQMTKEKIPKLKIYWWVTYDDRGNTDFPTDVEKLMTDNYKNEFGRLPDWHK